MVIKAVFFDFDGTVSDARWLALRSLDRTFKEFGYEVSREKILEFLGVKMERMLQEFGIGKSVVGSRKIEEIREKFYGYFIEGAKNGEIKPCVSLKPLWKMKEEGVKLFVISNSRRDFLDASIKTLEIGGLFDGVFGADDFDFKDEMIGKLIKKMRLKHDEVVYVGDRFSDVDFARKAGCIAIGISNRCSFSSRARLLRERPDYMVRDFYGLRRVVRGIS